jgi:hypothetical protein
MEGMHRENFLGENNALGLNREEERFMAEGAITDEEKAEQRRQEELAWRAEERSARAAEIRSGEKRMAEIDRAHAANALAEKTAAEEKLAADWFAEGERMSRENEELARQQNEDGDAAQPAGMREAA